MTLRRIQFSRCHRATSCEARGESWQSQTHSHMSVTSSVLSSPEINLQSANNDSCPAAKSSGNVLQSREVNAANLNINLMCQ